jgi:WD40 repeat protein
VWEVDGGKERFKARVTGMGGTVVTAAFSPDGQVVALAAADGPVDLWDVKAGKRLHTLLGRQGQGVRVAFSPDGKTVASVGPDYRIQRWAADGKPLGVSDPPPAGLLIAPVTGLAFADNERVIAWATAAQFAIAWEAPTGKLLSPQTEHVAAIRSISFPEGKDPHTSGQDGRVLRWDFETGKQAETINLRPARLPGKPIITPIVTLSADVTRAVFLGPPTEVFELPTGEDLFCVPPPSVPPAPVTLRTSADGLRLLTFSRPADARRPGSCVVWDLTTQKRVAEFDLPAAVTATPLGAALSPGGNRMVIISSTRNLLGKPVLLFTGYDLKTGKKLAEVEDTVASGTVTFALADETTAVATSSSGRVWSVDYAAGRIGEDIDKLPPRGEAMVQGPVAFSADGKRFATGIVSEQFVKYGVRVYDLPGRKALHTFVGHAGPVSALRFSPDGRFLASGAQDTSVLVWKLPGGK